MATVEGICILHSHNVVVIVVSFTAHRTKARQEEVSIYSEWNGEHIVVVGTEKCLILLARFLHSAMTPFVVHNIAFSVKAIQIKGNNILSHSL